MYYAHINNMGDALNRLIIENIFYRKEAEKSRIYDFDIMGIGSCLDALIYGPGIPSSSSVVEVRERVLSLLHGRCYIWGTGFLQQYPFETAKLKRNKTEFVMLRGEMTRRGVSQICGKNIEVPLADGGLLASKLIDESKIVKKYKIGIIPHFREKENAMIKKIKDFYKGVLIDVQKNPRQVVEEIASCEYIISSSLHGLIVADAFGIPNTRIKLTNAPLGTGFKFDDYYSAFDIKKDAIFVHPDMDLSRIELFDVPQIDHNQVVVKQNQLFSAMDYILSKIS